MMLRRELYRSPQGDAWFLGQEPGSGHAMVIHEANQPSGGHRTCLDLGQFLSAPAKGPEHQALLRLIGTLLRDPAPGPHDNDA